ncbi:MAG: 50S ribosomal protein L25, partial [Elusimicrobia bacterium]|nr:50S ribosomal protein L25 [Elusimicrobiota bacterium]
MDQITLESQTREAKTKGQLKKSRIDGLVPAVLYGSDEKTISLFVKEKEISKILRVGFNQLINLKVDGSPKTVLIKEIQKHVVSEKLLHVDFHAVSLQKEIEVEAPVHIIGECHGVKSQGGILEHVLRELKIRCLPTNIPKSIDIDVSNLNIGHNILVKDITPPANVTILSTKNSIIVHVVAPTKTEEPTAADAIAASPAEPEVIAKGKKEEDGSYL